jgi:probable phosphoglycerate mutase
MTKIVLVPSGTTDFDEQQRIVGTLDIPVSVGGQAQMEELAVQLRELPIEIVYSAPSQAARQSSQLLADRLGLKVRVVDDLENFHFGLWQGLLVSEVRRKHPKLIKQWEEHPATIEPPGGESVADAKARVEKRLRRLVRRHPHETIALVAPEPLRTIIRCCLTQTEVTGVLLNGAVASWEAFDVT